MTNSKPRVTVISRLTVVSSTPVKPGKSHPLSILDHSMGLHTLHIIFYYPHNEFVNIESFDLSNLRNSLSETLSYYPPVTGRLMRDGNGNWEVKYNDAGVRIVKAKVNCSLVEWLGSASGEEEKGLAVWEEMPEDPKAWSPFQIQMNEFVGGGIAIGLSCPHTHADPACATLLAKSWTELYRKSCISQPPFFHPPALRARTTPNTMTKSVKNYVAMSSLNTPLPAKMSTCTFLFSDAMIKKSLSEVQRKCPKATPFEMLAALFWSCINDASSPLSICFDFRKHMHAPLPYGFFGNALHFTKVSTGGNKMEDGGLDHLTEMVHDHLSAIKEEEYWSVVDWFDSKKDEDGKYAAPFKMYGTELTCVNMEHVSAYAAVLEDVKPLHVSYHIGNVEGEGVILVLPSPEEGLGRIVTVTLPEDQTDKLRKDPTILCLEPTMIVSGR